MKFTVSYLLPQLVLLIALSAVSVSTVKNSKEFEDFLTNMEEELQETLVKLSENSGGQNWDITAAPGQNQNLTCCLLGELAGSKGFHCYVDFYAARIMLRNRNRVHNRKMGFYGRYKVPLYGKRLMATFEQCVAANAAVFHRCCHRGFLATGSDDIKGSSQLLR